jgi:hypothetical protein
MTLAELRATAVERDRAHFAQPFTQESWQAVKDAWTAYRAAAKAATDLPRPPIARGTRFESAYWIDATHQPHPAQITRVTRDTIYYGMVNRCGDLCSSRFTIARAQWHTSALPQLEGGA